MTFGIPSYKRPECKTIDMLFGYGISADDIYVSLQSKSEVDLYKAVHPTVHYVYREADCAAGNRNTLLMTVGAPIVLLDDDITSIAVKLPGHNFRRLNDGKTLLNGISEITDLAKENKCAIAGVAATTNDLIARSRERYSFDCLLQGSFLIFLEDILFNEKWKMVEDYELSLRVVRSGKHILRANGFSANKPKNGTNPGGLHDRYASGELRTWITRLSQVYPEFKPNKDRTGGHIKFE